MIVLCIILALMFIVSTTHTPTPHTHPTPPHTHTQLAFSFCVYGSVQHNQPRYILLIINIVLSTSVTGLLVRTSQEIITLF